ncbi:MAG: Flagellar protein FliS [Planctomycetota bacterium]|jgi:flagellar protein FliS
MSQASSSKPGSPAPQNGAANAYLRTKVMSASPQELRLMLLDGAIRFANQGREALVRKDFEASFNGFGQCREIIIELMTSIRPDCDRDLSEKVRSLYGFMYKHLIDGVHEKDFAKIDEVIRLLAYERETWVMAMEKVAAEKGVASPAASAPADAAGKVEPKPSLSNLAA